MSIIEIEISNIQLKITALYTKCCCYMAFLLESTFILKLSNVNFTRNCLFKDMHISQVIEEEETLFKNLAVHLNAVLSN